MAIFGKRAEAGGSGEGIIKKKEEEANGIVCKSLGSIRDGSDGIHQSSKSSLFLGGGE